MTKSAESVLNMQDSEANQTIESDLQVLDSIVDLEKKRQEEMLKQVRSPAYSILYFMLLHT